MKIEERNGIVTVLRNKKKGIRLKVMREKEGGLFPCDKCALMFSSLCNDDFSLCVEIRTRKLKRGGFYLVRI